MPYILYSTPTPITFGEIASGGPIFIKTGTRVAYPAFETLALAELFCNHRAVPNAIQIIELRLLGTKGFPVGNTHAEKILLFRNAEVLDKYLRDTGSFRYDDYFADLQPNI